MIVTTVANVVLTLLNALFVFELPAFPDSVTSVFNTAVSYFGTGRDILQAFIGNTAMGVIGVCLALVVSANVIYFTVSLIFFVLKKIPFLGLSE